MAPQPPTSVVSSEDEGRGYLSELLLTSSYPQIAFVHSWSPLSHIFPPRTAQCSPPSLPNEGDLKGNRTKSRKGALDHPTPRRNAAPLSTIQTSKICQAVLALGLILAHASHRRTLRECQLPQVHFTQQLHIGARERCDRRQMTETFTSLSCTVGKGLQLPPPSLQTQAATPDVCHGEAPALGWVPGHSLPKKLPAWVGERRHLVGFKR